MLVQAPLRPQLGRARGAGLVYRTFCRIEGERVPDAKTLIRLAHVLNKPVPTQLLECLEIQAGFGRTGRMFAAEGLGVTPDIMVLSKSLGSGFPIAAVVSDDRLKQFGS